MLIGFHAPVFMGGSEAIGDLAAKLDPRPMQPSAVTADLKASPFDPATPPPQPRSTPAPLMRRSRRQRAGSWSPQNFSLTPPFNTKPSLRDQMPVVH
jgi:hypothetical protein